MTGSIWLVISQNSIWFIELLWLRDGDGYVVLRALMDGRVRGRIWGDSYFTLPRLFGRCSSGRMVGVSTWCITHGRHTWVHTSVGTIYVFLIFNIKCIRIMFSKIYMYYERTLVVPDVVLARWRSENVFDRPWCFFLKKWKIHRFIVIVSLKLKLIYIFVLYTACIDFMLSL